MVFFPNEELELWEYSESDIPNFFGETTEDYVYVGTYSCDFQPMSPKDSLNEFGKILEDTFKIYLDIGVPVTNTMILRMVGKPDTYSIVGSPIINNHNVLSHIKLVVQKQRKPVKLD